jgi:HEAT repeats
MRYNKINLFADNLKIHYLILTLVILAKLLLVSCDSDRRQESKAKLMSDDECCQTGKTNRRGQDPIKDALEILGLNYSQLDRPHFYEDGYNMLARMPLIDYLKTSPFRAHSWTILTSNKIQNIKNSSISESLRLLVEEINGVSFYHEKIRVENVNEDSLFEAYKYLLGEYSKPINPETEKIIKEANLSKKFDNQVGKMIYALADAAKMAEKAISGLSEEERKFITRRPERYFFPNNNHFDFLTGPTHSQQKIVSIARKIDFIQLYKSSFLITSALDDLVGFFKTTESVDDLFLINNNKAEKEGVILQLPSPVGDIVILGTGDTAYNLGKGALVIDLGGNDNYSGAVNPGKFSIIIERGGADVYNSRKSRFAQGFGCLSSGILVDLSGNDTYLAGDMAQGCGLFGVGVLADYAGDDYYRMGLLGQGFGNFGIGLLIDNIGNDRYIIGGLGQGAGSTLGIGLLCDKRGDDKYMAGENYNNGLVLDTKRWGHVQGAGLSIRSHKWGIDHSIYGGIGFLSEGGGNDFYYSSKENCMGSSYFMSFGAFVDHDGNDQYIPENGIGMGSAIHLSAAAFIDKSGNDRYYGGTQTGGVGSDRSVAIMADYDGDDVYGPSIDYIKSKIKNENPESKQLNFTTMNSLIQKQLADVSYGSAKKPNAIGVMIDCKGNDRYFSRDRGWGESCGGVMPPKEPQHWSNSLQIDLGGKDYYSKTGRKDNHYHLYFDHGLSYDVEYEGNAIDYFLGKYSTEIKKNDNSDTLVKTNIREGVTEASINLGLLSRFNEIEMIAADGSIENLSDLVGRLKNSVNDDLNKSLLEALQIIILKQSDKSILLQHLTPLLDAKDTFVKFFTVRALGWWRINGARQEVLKLANDPNDFLRYHVIWSLGRMGNKEDIMALINKAEDDSSLKCRQQALSALNSIIKDNKVNALKLLNDIKNVLLKLINSNDEIIRYYAAEGLGYFGNSHEIINILKNNQKDKSYYVQRQIARALILNGHEEGISLLIESLKFRSIDTFKHYNNEIAKELAFYCGVDYSDETRYKYATWKDWWEKNRFNIDLELNLKIMNKINTAFLENDNMRGVEIFEKLLNEYPENMIVKKNYLEFCKHWIEYEFLTLPDITKDIIDKCIQLQGIILKIGPDNFDAIKRMEYFKKWKLLFK